LPRLIRAALEASGVKDPGRVSSGVDVIGDIAIVRLEGFNAREKRKIAQALLDEMSNVRVVMEQEGGIEGEFRLKRLGHLAGERRTMTLHRENGCVFRVDVARCYFSPRLSTERLRIAKEAGRKERVLNMFAGVGPFSITVAKLAGAHVTSFEINEFAAKLHRENNRLNKVESLVDVFSGDVASCNSEISSRFDRILMPLPERANEFLPTALRMAKRGAVVHYYRHVLGENEAEATESLRGELGEILPPSARYRTRRVRAVGPRWLEMAADISLRR
jgi:tRNA (guanine37-N1)-methyltransferase